MSKLANDFTQLSKEDLNLRITELRTEILAQKRARAAGELANQQAIKKTRRSIATALTIQAKLSDDVVKKEEA